ncbi:MAG: PEGA domain protein [Candidatus Methanofastidiosum methylothiophilum]|uniref:PEGA domain protein n=1 Tax=Candidatus Methanofastidiosum methylothiophilum TaxID=1705564 RepID=A0A150J8P5_9EURY|nr:MAG: PEGA domain protein [Candidatus Methanofastidiosum methylthiophilus]
MNKKILSFIFGSLMMFSLFGAIEFQEVAAASMAVNITTNANTYTQPYFNSGSMPMRLKFNIIVTGTVTPTWTNLQIQAPANYVLAAEGLQPAPSGFTIDYATSTADGVAAAALMAYTCSITSAGTYTIFLDLVSCTAAPGSHTWTVTPTGGGLAVATPSTVVDNTAPTFDVTYIKTPRVSAVAPSTPAMLGTGTVTIRVQANEPMLVAPTIQVQQPGLAMTPASSITPQSGSYPDTVVTCTYSITSSGGVNDGLAQVTITAKDRAGNSGSTINSIVVVPTNDGPTFIVDSQTNKPTLMSPNDGFASTNNTVTFSWNRITEGANNPVTYTLQYSQSSTFSSGITTVSGPFDDSVGPPSTYLGGGTGWTAGPGVLINYQATGLAAGTWYWRVAATDSLGNTISPLSLLTPRSFTITSSDTTPPNFRVLYQKTPKIDYNVTPDVLGSGALSIKIHASETLKRNPTVQIRLHNQTTWTTLSVTPTTPASIYTASYTIPTGTTNNGFAQISISGEDLQGNVGSDINASRWYGIHNTSPYPTSEEDSDGPSFYVSTTTDTPSLYKPDNGYVIPNNRNEANFTFYKISDLTAERPSDLGQNNCITYHIQYSTSSTFTTNVVTQSVDINEAATTIHFCEPLKSPTTYNNWDITWTGKPVGFDNLRRHRSQALSNGTWYWRTWATDKLGNQSPYSETRSFIVSSTVPNLISPSDLSLLNFNNPVLRWQKVPSGTFYNIRLSRGDTNFLDYTLYPDKIAVNGFTNASLPNIYEYNVSFNTPPTPPIGRLEDGIWYWKVASSLDTTIYSETWRFTVDTTGPPAPNLLTLTNGQVSQNKRPTFTWSAVTDTNDLSNPVRYYIQISGDPTFPGTPGSTWPATYGSWKTITYMRGPLTTPSFVPTSDFPETLLTDPGAAYYWRVYAVDSALNVGTNSVTRNFRVSTSPPLYWGDLPAGNDSICDTPWPTGCLTGEDPKRDQLALALRSPSNGFTLNSRNPQLEWRHSRCDCVVKEISSYIIEYSTDITFPPEKTTDVSGVFQVLGINVDNNLFVNMGYTIQTPLFNGTYFWRVCSVDTAGNRTQFTAPWSFTVNVPNNEQPASQCSATVPCPSGFTCQNGACVAVSYSPGNLTLTVQNAAGTAISGATVTVDGVAQTTDASGQVTYTALSGGSHTINNITASGYIDYGTSTVLINGNTSQTITMTVPGTEGYIWGTIYFDAVGTAAPNVLIDIYNQSTDVKVDSRLTNSEGKFQSSPLPSTGTYYAKIPAYEKELRDLQPTSLTTGEKIVILETKGTVTGIVQDDTGQIVSAATVVLKKYPGEAFVDTKTTNSIGQFSFDALPGTYVVTISKAGYDAYTSSSFSVQSKQTVNLQSVLGNIVLNAIRGTLTVSVKDDKGATINTATVTIRSSAGAVVRSITTSGGTGSTQLAPGAYRVSAVSSGFAESLQQTTNITSNQTSSVSITLAPATGSIRVVAKDASGAALAGASVYVDGSLSGITDSNGELLVTGLKLGTHTVRITKGGYTTVEEQVTSGESTVVVDTALPKNNLMLYLGIGLGLLIIGGAVYFLKFAKKGTGPRRPPMPSGPALPGRPGTPKLRPHRHKGGLPPSSIRVKKKNL